MTTRLVDDREAGLQVGFEATDWAQPISYDTYQQALEDWQIQVIVRDGKNIGAVYKKDGEVHVSVLKPWRKRWMTKGLIRAILDSATKTKVSPGHEHYMFSILARLGMTHTGHSEFALKGN